MAHSAALHKSWEVHKDAILDLYLKQNKTLSDVMTAMAQRGFKRTKPQYERILKSWGATKNISKDEWKYITKRLQRREATNKATSVRVRGCIVSRAKIHKQRKLYEYQSTFSRISSQFRAISIPSSPPGIEIFTPEVSPSPISRAPFIPEEPSMNKFNFLEMIGTPWEPFHDLASSLAFAEEATSFYCRKSDITHISPPQRLEYRLAQSAKLSKVALAWDIHEPTWNSVVAIHRMLCKPEAFVPRVLSQSSRAEFDAIVGVSGKMSEIELMRLAIVSLSNNHDAHIIAPFIVKLAEDQRLRLLFRALLTAQTDTFNAAAEKLLLPAVRAENIEMVKILIEAGVDVNLRPESDAQTALQCSIESENLTLVAYLLDSGVTDWRASYCLDRTHGSRQISGTVLDLAIRRGYEVVAQMLLERAHQHKDQSFEVTTLTLRHALFEGRAGVVKHLLQRWPDILGSSTLIHWLSYEAAAARRGGPHLPNGTSHLLHRPGFTDDEMLKDCGDVLAAACIRPNMAVVQKLLSRKISINEPATGVTLAPNTAHNASMFEKALSDIRGRSALHVAIAYGHTSLVRLLLEHGADSQQICGSYPIQVAARMGHRAIIEMLLKSGASVNATVGRVRNPSDDQDHLSHLTALHLAILEGHFDVALTLHEAQGSLLGANGDRSRQSIAESVLPMIMQRGSQYLVEIAIVEWCPWAVLNANFISIGVTRFGHSFFSFLMKNGVTFDAAEARLPVICREICLDNAEIVDELVSDCHEHYGMMPQHHRTRALVLAVRLERQSIAETMLRIGYSPFEIISETSEDGLVHIDREYNFRVGDSPVAVAFSELQSLKYAELLLDWEPGLSSSRQRLLRFQRLCEAYVSASCKDVWCYELEELLRVQGISTTQVDRYLGRGYFESALRNALSNFVEKRNYLAFKRILIENRGRLGSLINSSLRNGQHTPLQIVAWQNEGDLVRDILQLGADVNAVAREVQGATALQFAAMNGNFEIVNILLEAGANINADPAAVDGRTAIEGAAEWGRLHMVGHLLDLGADMKDHSNYRRTVYRAWKNGHHTIVRKVQAWRIKKCGDDDYESPETIVESMTLDELTFADGAAKWNHPNWQSSANGTGPLGCKQAPTTLDPDQLEDGLFEHGPHVVRDLDEEEKPQSIYCESLCPYWFEYESGSEST
ncbi:hypothetical protein FB567DRAFT_613374 [Paraphoma chrysanthemicola]|uniref:Clr5 domain-containing protein n=1 Tax=Paraphoma chrysanthemicola TaxID=798071 RepID=A0A8K0QTM4_9PLEO|nr:hypothetical protein FB567DRAFT_613374 [Paraphoma chrysanthemicola]